ncbi:MAG: helix-turn-helix domain-containing protein [Hyphomicrobiales bacterium]
MAIENDELRFNEALCARVHQWRREKNWTAAQMATALGIPAERYRKYEKRSPLPPYLMERFCLVCDATLENLVIGIPRNRQRPIVVAMKDHQKKEA